MQGSERRLAAIMFTDMVGYTALGQRNEELSLALVKEHRKVIRPVLLRHGGDEIKTMGDAFLVEFPNALEAVRCAYDIQRAVRELNFSLSEGKKVHLRVGIHLGDVVEEGGDISGDAVNVASRIESLAEDGGVCMTRQVYDQVRNKFELPLSPLGPRALKNVSEPLEVYRMVMPWGKEGQEAAQDLDPKRIVVLPFVSMSPDPNDEYFADGLTEELITRISLVKGVEVIARTSAMNYKKEKKNASQIGRELRVGTLLEGSVRKAGSRIRVTTQMINSSTEGHLWAENYDRNLDDVFAIQSEIAEKVAAELKVQLLGSEKKTLEQKPTNNTEAYSDFLRGRELYREGSETSLRQGLRYFEKAVDLDPSFARAYVGVAECHERLAMGFESNKVTFPAVRASLKRALELDPDLAEAHASLALLRFYEDDVPASEAEAKRALELNPSLPEPYSILYGAAALRGEPEEMVRNAEAAYRLDPIRPDWIFQLAQAYFFTGREQDGIDHCRRTEDVAPADAYSNMTSYYLAKGDIGKARELHAKFEKLRPTSPWVIVIWGLIDAAAGEREKALQAIKRIEERDIGSLIYNYVALVYHALGDMDRYFENINRAVDEHTLSVVTVMYSPLLAKARDDPRYAKLVDKIRRQTGLVK